MKSPQVPFILSILSLIIAITGLFFSFFNTNQSQTADKMAILLKEKPEILTDSIEENPAAILTALQTAAVGAREEMAKQREEEEKKKLEEYFTSPLEPEIGSDRAVLGPKNAPLTLVTYSDFECPYCKRGLDTVNKLREQYSGKIKYVYKHLPLSFHDNAKIAAQYFEGIALQDVAKAYKFHDLLFAEQSKLKRGETFLKSIAKKAGANMAKLAKDITSKKVLDRIKADEREAAKFGIQGTPGFVLNGIPVKGALPAEHFNDKIISKLVSKGKVAL